VGAIPDPTPRSARIDARSWWEESDHSERDKGHRAADDEGGLEANLGRDADVVRGRGGHRGEEDTGDGGGAPGADEGVDAVGGSGLTLDGQGFDAFTLFLAKVLPAQSRASGDQFWVNTARDVHTATATAYGIVRVSDVGDPIVRLDAARLLQPMACSVLKSLSRILPKEIFGIRSMDSTGRIL
jgi:hypothetical protein